MQIQTTWNHTVKNIKYCRLLILFFYLWHIHLQTKMKIKYIKTLSNTVEILWENKRIVYFSDRAKPPDASVVRRFCSMGLFPNNPFTNFYKINHLINHRLSLQNSRKLYFRGLLPKYNFLNFYKINYLLSVYWFYKIQPKDCLATGPLSTVSLSLRALWAADMLRLLTWLQWFRLRRCPGSAEWRCSRKMYGV